MGKTVVLPKLDLGPMADVATALDFAVGRDILRQVHGDTFHVERWEEDRRTYSFSIEVPSVPRILRPFLFGDRLRVTTDQKITRKSPDETIIDNDVRLGCAGARFVRIRPTLQVTRGDSGRFFFHGRVDHDVFLPFPINKIAEKYMADRTWAEFRRMTTTVQPPFR